MTCGSARGPTATSRPSARTPPDAASTLYHEQFRAERDRSKHEHVRQVARALPELRAEVAADLDGRGLSRARVTACAVRLLDLGFIRIGSDRHAHE